jgi:hypothetical protein
LPSGRYFGTAEVSSDALLVGEMNHNKG